MQIVIDISDEDYNRIKDTPDAFNSLTSRLYKATKHGTPLPKGHGRLIDADAVFDKMQSTFDMQDLYLPIHLKELIVDEMPTIIEADREGEYDR